MHNYKSFESFNKAMRELREDIPFIEEYIGEQHESTEKDIVSRLMNKVIEKFPSVLNPEYPATYAITVNASEVGFKTGGFYSFGWKTELHMDGKIIYKMRITFMGKHPNNPLRVKIENTLKEHEWRQVEENRTRADVEKSAVPNSHFPAATIGHLD